MSNTITLALVALALGGMGGTMRFRRDVRAHAAPPASDQADETTPDPAYAQLDAYQECQLAALNIPGAAPGSRPGPARLWLLELALPGAKGKRSASHGVQKKNLAGEDG